MVVFKKKPKGVTSLLAKKMNSTPIQPQKNDVQSEEKESANNDAVKSKNKTGKGMHSTLSNEKDATTIPSAAVIKKLKSNPKSAALTKPKGTTSLLPGKQLDKDSSSWILKPHGAHWDINMFLSKNVIIRVRTKKSKKNFSIKRHDPAKVIAKIPLQEITEITCNGKGGPMYNCFSIRGGDKCYYFQADDADQRSVLIWTLLRKADFQNEHLYGINIRFGDTTEKSDPEQSNPWEFDSKSQYEQTLTHTVESDVKVNGKAAVVDSSVIAKVEDTKSILSNKKVSAVAVKTKVNQKMQKQKHENEKQRMSEDIEKGFDFKAEQKKNNKSKKEKNAEEKTKHKVPDSKLVSKGVVAKKPKGVSSILSKQQNTTSKPSEKSVPSAPKKDITSSIAVTTESPALITKPKGVKSIFSNQKNATPKSSEKYTEYLKEKDSKKSSAIISSSSSNKSKQTGKSKRPKKKRSSIVSLEKKAKGTTSVLSYEKYVKPKRTKTKAMINKAKRARPVSSNKRSATSARSEKNRLSSVAEESKARSILTGKENTAPMTSKKNVISPLKKYNVKSTALDSKMVANPKETANVMGQTAVRGTKGKKRRQLSLISTDGGKSWNARSPPARIQSTSFPFQISSFPSTFGNGSEAARGGRIIRLREELRIQTEATIQMQITQEQMEQQNSNIEREIERLQQSNDQLKAEIVDIKSKLQ